MSGSSLGRLSMAWIFLRSLILSLTFSWWAVRWEFRKRKLLPNRMKPTATAP